MSDFSPLGAPLGAPLGPRIVRHRHFAAAALRDRRGPLIDLAARARAMSRLAYGPNDDTPAPVAIANRLEAAAAAIAAALDLVEPPRRGSKGRR